MVSRLLALRIFEAFSIQRWNDRIRPVELTEMDKQGFKTMLAYVFAKMEEDKGNDVDWDYIIYGSVFALLKNIVLSDIKAPVLKKIREEKEAYRELNLWVVQQYEPLFPDDKEFLDRFSKFLLENDSEENVSLRVLKAAHKYSTLREFEIIESANMTFPKLSSIRNLLNKELVQYYDLDAVPFLIGKQDLYEAICLIEQLRFQTRWSQTPRIPKTSVLGHSMYVATIMLFLSREIKACPKRMYNNFFAGLFHDLPESVVRDIVSPVKRATSSLPDIVKKIEDDVCDKELFPKLPKCISDDLKYLLAFNIDDCDEFSTRLVVDNITRELHESESIDKYNFDGFSLVDGAIIKLADEVAAYMEADQSINHGITSRHLQEGMARIRFKYMDKKEISGINVVSFFMSFT